LAFFVDDENLGRDDGLPAPPKAELTAAPCIVPESNAGGGVMTNSFLIVMSIWFGINILFVVVRLWVTRADRWRNCDNGAGQLSAVCVKSRRPCHV
jgi:hypothetical protein